MAKCFLCTPPLASHFVFFVLHHLPMILHVLCILPLVNEFVCDMFFVPHHLSVNAFICVVSTPSLVNNFGSVLFCVLHYYSVALYVSCALFSTTIQ